MKRKLSESEIALRKKLNIPLGAQVTVLELKPDIERVTEGWTDDQIEGKSVEEFDAMIRSAELAIDKMEESVRQQRNLVASYRKLRKRRLELGG